MRAAMAKKDAEIAALKQGTHHQPTQQQQQFQSPSAAASTPSSATSHQPHHALPGSASASASNSASNSASGFKEMSQEEELAMCEGGRKTKPNANTGAPGVEESCHVSERGWWGGCRFRHWNISPCLTHHTHSSFVSRLQGAVTKVARNMMVPFYKGTALREPVDIYQGLSPLGSTPKRIEKHIVDRLYFICTGQMYGDVFSKHLDEVVHRARVAYVGQLRPQHPYRLTSHHGADRWKDALKATPTHHALKDYVSSCKPRLPRRLLLCFLAHAPLPNALSQKRCHSPFQAGRALHGQADRRNAPVPAADGRAAAHG